MDLYSPYDIYLPLVAAIFNLFLIALVLRKSGKSLVHYLFIFFLLGLGIWAFAVFMLRNSSTAEDATIWQKICLPAGAFGAVFYYHFTVLFTRTSPKKPLLVSAYLLATLVLVLVPTNLLIKGTEIRSFGYAPELGILFPMYFISLYLFVFLGLANLIKAFRTAGSYQERNRAAYIIAGTCCLLLGGIADGIVVAGFGLHPYGTAGNMLFSLVATVAILKYHLLDIPFLIRKGTAYLLVCTLVAIPYVGVILLANYVFRTGDVPIWTYLVLLLMFALALQPLWKWAQQLVDRWFYRERYDYLEALRHFSREAQSVTDLKQLSSSLVNLVAPALQASGAYLLLPSPAGDFTVASSNGSNNPVPALSLKSHSPLIQWMRDNEGFVSRRDLDVSPQLQSLSTEERESLNKIEAELCVPMKTPMGELAGVLIIGEKRSQQPYSPTDEQLIFTVASQMSVSLENARLYDIEQAQRRELERQIEEKTEFLSSVAHELKTPLTAIIASAELLTEEDDASPPSFQCRANRLIASSARSMNKKVSLLLDLARMQHTDLPLELQPLDLISLVKEAQAQAYSIVQGKEQTLRLELADSASVPLIEADKERLMEVLLNLLSNASKFSPKGSSITMRVRATETELLVEVEDQAPAITPEESRRIFNPYYRGAEHDKRRLPGLGLGLAICRRILEMHGGRIWVQSEVGKGNTFVFALPLHGEGTRGDTSRVGAATG